MSSVGSRAISTATRWGERVNDLLPVRVWNRLSLVRGAVLVKGIAYSAFFSIFPIVALAFTALGLVLRSRPEWQDRLVDDVTTYLEQNLPGVVATEENPGGLIDPAQIVGEFTGGGLLSWAAAVAAVTLIWAALGWVGALRLGIRAAMHLPVADFNPVVAKIRDFGVALLIGGAIVVSAIASVSVNTATNRALDLIGIPSGDASATTVRIVSFVAVAALDTLLFYLQFKLLAASPLPRRYLWRAALVAGVAYGLLKQVAGLLLGNIGEGGATSVIATATVGILSVLALLIWMNFVARLTLLAAAWAGLMADEAAEAAEPGEEAQAVMLREAAAAAAHGGAGRLGPTTAVAVNGGGPTGRAEDRVVLAAGLVLGATAAIGVRAVGSALAAVAGVVAGALPGDRSGRDEDD